MAGLKPGSAGVGSDRSANSAATSAQFLAIPVLFFLYFRLFNTVDTL